MKSILAAMLLAQSVISPVNAAFFDGNKLYSDCKTAKIFVLGFVAGTFDANEAGQSAMFTMWLQAMAETKQLKLSEAFEKAYSDGMIAVGSYCVPKGIILEQATDIFCQYLSSHPGDRHLAAAWLLTRALDQAWPCKGAAK